MSDIPKEYTPVGCRLAIREEGGVIRAYFAEMDSMDGAMPIATLGRSIVEEDGGRHGPLFEAWLIALQEWQHRVVSRATGLPAESVKSFTIDAKPHA